MSKNITNCVPDCANDCNMKIYHQDTDSIHVNCDDVDTVVQIYQETYEVYLAGGNLVQFHVGFTKRSMCIKGLILSNVF